MTQNISEGFVSYVDSFQAAGPDEEVVQWDCPTLQVLDIQLFVGRNPKAHIQPPLQGSPPKGPEDVPRFYIALSDTKNILWGIVPPTSPLERLIKDTTVEIGSLVVIEDYAIVLAANRRKVVVIAAGGLASPVPLSLFGSPYIDETAFRLSTNSLIERQRQLDNQAQLLQQHKTKGRRSGGGSGGPDDNQRPPVSARQSIFLSTLWEEHETLSDFDKCHTWVLYVRVTWKSKLRKIVGGGDAAEGSAASSRCVFDAIVVDEKGDAVKVVFNGGRKLHEKFQVQDCLFLGSGTVCLRDAQKRSREDDGEDGDGPHPPSSQYVPSHFLVTESSLIQLASEPQAPLPPTLPTIDVNTIGGRGSTQLAVPTSELPLPAQGADPNHLPSLPMQPRRLLQGAETEFVDVQEVLTRCTIGDIINIQGTLVSQDPSITQVTTRNGRVDKFGLVFRDRARRSTIAVTLWGPIAHSVSLPLQLGTTWQLRDVTVRAFGSNLTISSRSSSEVTMQPTTFSTSTLFGGGTTNAAPQQAQEISLTYAPTTQAVPPPPFSLELPKRHSSVVPSLVRIQYVSVPMTYNACWSCGTRMVHNTCQKCHSVRGEPRYCIELILSDGLDSARAVVMGDLGTSLCGEQVRSFTAKCVDPDYPLRLASVLVGRSVLVELAYVPAADGSRADEYYCSSIQHVHHAACAYHMVAMLNNKTY